MAHVTALVILILALSSLLASYFLQVFQDEPISNFLAREVGRTARDRNDDDVPLELSLDTGWTLTSKIERYNNSRAMTIHNLTLPISAVLEAAKLQYATRPEPSNPLLDSRETELSWVSEVVWEFSRKISIETLCLYDVIHFQGLDTVATIWINDKRLAFVKNAHLPYRYDDLQRDLCASSHHHHKWKPDKQAKIRIEIFPSLLYARVQALMRFPAVYPHTVNYNTWTEPTHRNLLRKPASDFGWDWGPAFPDARVAKVALVRVSPKTGCRGLGELEEGSVHTSYTLDEKKEEAIVRVAVAATAFQKDAEGGWCRLAVRFENATHVDRNGDAELTFRLVHPRLWFPRREGREANRLYSMEIFVTHCTSLGACEEEDGDDGESQGRRRRILKRTIGFRHVKLVEEKGRFELFVNGERVMMRGTNVVPPDPFPSRAVVSSKYDSLIDDAIRMNQNTLRIWGGGFPPPSSFYTRCDEEGILVWHDLPWACAAFPADIDSLEEARLETSLFLSRFSFHPSIVIVGGNNEVEASFTWFKETSVNTAKYRRDYVALFERAIGGEGILARAMAEHRLVYLDSSPSNGHSFWKRGRKIWGNVDDPTRGDVHFYDYRGDCEEEEGGGKVLFYPRALMISEHGTQSLPMGLGRYASRKTSTRKEDDDREAMLFAMSRSRMRHEGGFQQMRRAARRRGLELVFPEESSSSSSNTISKLSYRENAFVTQVIQARCLSKAIEVWRFSRENTGGVLIWQLNDAWSGASWSLVEYDEGWKLGAYAVRSRFDRAIARLVWGNDGAIVRCEMEIEDIHDDDLAATAEGEIRITQFNLNDDVPFLQTTTMNFTFDFNGEKRQVGKIVAQIAQLAVNASSSSSSSGRATSFRLEGYYRLNSPLSPHEDGKKTHTFPPYYLFPPNLSFSRDLVPDVSNDESTEVSLRECVVRVLPKPYVRLYLWLSYDEGENVFQENGFNLLPGESKTVSLIKGACERPLDEAKMTLISLNSIVAKLNAT